VRVTRDQLNRLATHLIARLFDLCAGRDHYFGTQLKAEVIRFESFGRIEDLDRRTLQRDHHLSGCNRQTFPGTYIEWDASPAPGIDGKKNRREALGGGS